jgi:hypothetical protein
VKLGISSQQFLSFGSQYGSFTACLDKFDAGLSLCISYSRPHSSERLAHFKSGFADGTCFTYGFQDFEPTFTDHSLAARILDPNLRFHFEGHDAAILFFQCERGKPSEGVVNEAAVHSANSDSTAVFP